MGFQHFGFLLYKECVQEASYPSLISYGQIAHTKNLDLQDQQKRLIVDEEEALTTQKTKRSSFRKNNKEANSVRVPDKKKDVSKIICYNCQKLGHFSYDCPQGKGKRKYRAHVAEEEESPSSKKALAEIKDYAL
jgi:hypothetical protein